MNQHLHNKLEVTFIKDIHVFQSQLCGEVNEKDTILGIDKHEFQLEAVAKPHYWWGGPRPHLENFFCFTHLYNTYIKLNPPSHTHFPYISFFFLNSLSSS